LGVTQSRICAQNNFFLLHLTYASYIAAPAKVAIIPLSFLNLLLILFPHTKYCSMTLKYSVLPITFSIHSWRIFTTIDVKYFLNKIRYKTWHPDFPPSYASFLLGPIQLSNICSNCHILVWVDQAQLNMTFRLNIRNPMVPLHFIEF